jgi:hypothetical protein
VTSPYLSAPTGTLKLRPEARPVRFADLEVHQQQAFTDVVSLLSCAAADVRTAAGPQSADLFDQFADAHLPSRSILVNGERGTGKTTLLLSLKEALTEGHVGQPDDGLQDGPPDTGRMQAWTAEAVRSLRRRLVWLETLDMESMSTHPNVLGAVLARVESAVAGPALSEATVTSRSLLGSASDVHDVLRDLARLQTSVALAFAGNLADRAGHLDPDSFGAEARRSERERLGLGPSFRKVLSALSTQLEHSSRRFEKPLFVLPIDDLDLNPGECITALRRLRVVQSPHLVVVIAADVTLLETILHLMCLGELAQIAQPVELAAPDQRQAKDLATNILHKHLPPAQRVRLEFADPAWALDFCPRPGSPRLRDLLADMMLPRDEASFLPDNRFWVPKAGPQSRSQPQPASTVTSTWALLPAEKEERRIHDVIKGYSWPEALRMSARRVVDLYLDLDPSPDPDKASARRGLNGDLVRKYALGRLHGFRQDLQRGDDVAGFTMHPRMSRPTAPVSDVPEVVDLPWDGWDILHHGSPLLTSDARAFIGCLGLTSERERPRELEPSVPSLRETHLPPAPGKRPNIIPWPWVSHSTIWGYERALKLLQQADKQWAAQPDARFGSWISVMTAQLFDVIDDPGHPLDLLMPEIAGDWETLRARFDKLPDPDPTQELPLVSDWRLAVGLLCTPEMGMKDPDRLTPAIPDDLVKELAELRERRFHSFPEADRYVKSLPTTSR